jgi:hypothetical protein
MRDPPLSVIETWPKPNYVNPETRGKALLVVNAIMLTITVLVVAGRMWARFRISKSPGIDDVFVGFAMVCSFPDRTFNIEAKTTDTRAD